MEGEWNGGAERMKFTELHIVVVTFHSRNLFSSGSPVAHVPAGSERRGGRESAARKRERYKYAGNRCTKPEGRESREGVS